MAGYEIFGDRIGSSARTVVVVREEIGSRVGGGVPRHAKENGEGEEGVDVNDAVEGEDVDSGGGGSPPWNDGHGGGK